MAWEKALGGKEKGKEKYTYIAKKKKRKKKKSLQMAQPGWARQLQERLGVLGPWKEGPESSSAACKGEIGRGDWK